MPINNQGSNLQVITNVEGELVDNDEYVANRAYHEHNRESYPNNVAWSKNYDPTLEEYPTYVEDKEPIEDDDAIREATNQDLINRGIKP